MRCPTRARHRFARPSVLTGMFSRVASLVPLLCIVACSAEDAETSRSAAKASAPLFQNVRIVGAEAAPAPDGIATGRFVREGDCLLFVADGGKAYNPVIAGEASIGRAADGEPVVSLQGKAIELGRRIKVGGGGSGDVAGLSEAQRKCSDAIFVVGEVLDERF
jgi:hypothetical protein